MLQTRPASASGILPSQGQPSQQFGPPQQRNSFYGNPNGLAGSAVYRGTSTPIQPYAFTATPSLNPAMQWQQFGNARASSSPTVPTMQSFEHNNARPRYPASVSMTNLPSSVVSMGYTPGGARDDSALPGTRRVAPAPRPQSAHLTGSATQVSFAQATPVRVSPERYRRPVPRPADSGSVVQQPTSAQGSAAPSGSGMATVGHLYNSQKLSAPRARTAVAASRPSSAYASATSSAADDMQLYRRQVQAEAKRFRRRSMPALDSADYPKPLTPHVFKQPDDSSSLQQFVGPKNTDKEDTITRIASVNDDTMNSRNGSSESVATSHSNSSRPSSVGLFPKIRAYFFPPSSRWKSVLAAPFELMQAIMRRPNPLTAVPLAVCESQHQCNWPHWKPRLALLDP
jgi:hypothetical protein